MRTTKNILTPSPFKGKRGRHHLLTVLITLLAALSSTAGAQNTTSAEADSLIGKWTLAHAALSFESEAAGQAQEGNLSVARIRNFVASALLSAGLEEGTLAFTFTPEGTCAVAARGNEVGTTYTAGNGRLIINFPSSSLTGNKSTEEAATTNEKGSSVGTLYKQEADRLTLAIRAEKLAALLQTLGFEHKAVYNIITVGKFMNNYQGLLVGLDFER